MDFAHLSSAKPALSAFFNFRPSVAAPFSFDYANVALFTALNALKFTAVVYGINKITNYLYPEMSALLEREAPSTSDGANSPYVTNQPVKNWRTAAKAFFTIIVKAPIYHLSAHFIENVVTDYSKPVSAFNIPTLVLKGIHWGMHRIFFKDPSAMLAEVSAAGREATREAFAAMGVSNARVTGGPAAAAAFSSIAGLLKSPFPFTRVALNDIFTDVAFYKIGVAVFSICSETGSTFVKESAARVIELQRMMQFTMADTFNVVLTVSLCDTILSFVTFYVIPKLRRQPTVYSFVLSANEFLNKFAAISFVNALCCKLFGAKTFEFVVGGIHVPVWMVGFTFSMVGYAIGALSEALIRGVLLPAVMFRLRLNQIAPGRSRFNMKASPEANAYVSAKMLQDADDLFLQVTGRPFRSLSPENINSLQWFASVCIFDAYPYDTAIQQGLLEFLTATLALTGNFDRATIIIFNAIESSELSRPNARTPTDPIAASSAAVDSADNLSPEPSMTSMTGEGASNDPCCVCLRQLDRDADDILIVTKCKHVFHAACLRDFFSSTLDGDGQGGSGLTPQCPLCNVPLVKAAATAPFDPPGIFDSDGDFAVSCHLGQPNESGMLILHRIFQLYSEKVPFGSDFRMLSIKQQSDAVFSTDLIAMQVLDMCESIGVEKQRNTRIRNLAVNFAPYAKVFPDLSVDPQTGDVIETTAASYSWDYIVHVGMRSSYANSLFPSK